MGLAVRCLTANDPERLGRSGRVDAWRGSVLLCAVAFGLAGCLGKAGGQPQVDLRAPASGVTSPAGIDASAPPAMATASAPAPSRPNGPASRTAGLIVPPHLRPGAGPETVQGGDAPQVTGSLATSAAAPAKTTERPAPRKPIRLADAVASAVMTHPEIRIGEARMREARAGISVASAALYPSADIRLAAGGNFSGSYEGTTVPYKLSTNTVDGRLDGGIILRQLIFDFGAASSDIKRAELLRDSEKLKLKDKVDEIAYKTTQSYLKVMEQRALLALADEIIGAHENLLKVVQAHAKEGHGTVADVQRVTSRLIDVRAIRADVSLQLKGAEDQFERFTRQRPSGLVAPPDVRKTLPSSPTAAIAEMLAGNPRLAALQSGTQSSRKELESQRASLLPKINLEVESETKNFRNGPLGRTQGEARAMLAMRYRLLDGGLGEASQQQILARIESGEFSYLNEREQLEADIRQAYRAIDSAGRKLKLVLDGVTSARKVRELYLEQFKGGKRTVFELLDSQMSFFTIRRNQIENQFEGQRAMFDILRATGTLTKVLSRSS
jgi:outer membrane protein, adhesin transport system